MAGESTEEDRNSRRFRQISRRQSLELVGMSAFGASVAILLLERRPDRDTGASTEECSLEKNEDGASAVTPEEDKVAPTVPSDLKVAGKTDTTVTLDWEPSIDNERVAYYDIYLDGEKRAESIDTTETVTDLDPNTSYDFYVVALDTTGNESETSSTTTEMTDEESPHVRKWEMYEQSFSGPSDGNPYQDVSLSATFTHASSDLQKVVKGFWDGNDVYRIRFMPTKTGDWTYETTSNANELDGVTGSVSVGTPQGNNHGPVTVDPDNEFHFRYADGTRFYPFGTTVYGMAQVQPKKVQMTLDALDTYGVYQGKTPFNKVRLSALEHRPTSNLDPDNDDLRDKNPQNPLPGLSRDENDEEYANPDWFERVDNAVEALLERGIQADLILFHAKCSPGLKQFTKAQADRLVEYIVARYGAYRNVWWSLSNEWQLTPWDQSRWNEIGHLIRETDQFRRLASNHTAPCKDFVWGQDWVSHVSAQRRGCTEPDRLRFERSTYEKPYINDEYRYEGPSNRFGTTPKKVVLDHWNSLLGGAYGTHGETWDQQFFRGGGNMHAESTQRIAFARYIIEQSPADRGLEPVSGNLNGVHQGEEYYLFYYGTETPDSKRYDMQSSATYHVDVIDTWNMTITGKGQYSGTFTVELPCKQYMAVRLTQV